MPVTCIATTAEFDALAHQWDGLARGVPFRTWTWLRTWWKHYSAGRELYVLVAYDDHGTLLGGLPLFREHDGARGSTLHWLGSGEVCSDYLTLLTTRGQEEAVSQEIAQWLIEATSDVDNSWDHLHLDGVATTDSTMAHLVAALTESGCSCHRQPGLNCWQLPLAASWDAMLATMSKNRRKLVRRWQRDLEVEHLAERFTATDADELADGMRILVDLHQKRRQTLNQPGCFASPQFSSFLHEVAEKLLESGALRLSWLAAQGQPIAAEFKVQGGDTLYAYQSGIEPSAMHLSPGNLIATADLRAAIDEGCAHYDLLRGDEEYKALWGATPHGTLYLRIAANRLAPRLQHGLWLAGFTMKNWVKSGMTLTGMN